MKRVIGLVEQLEEAFFQLNKRTAVGARLALLLVDNLVELLMYEEAKFVLSLYALLDGLPTPQKYPPKKRRDVLDHFNPKVNFLVRDEHRISEDEGELIKSGHRFRNEAYHIGALRQSILIPVSQTYFMVACTLLPRLGCSGGVTYHGSDELEEAEAFLQVHGVLGVRQIDESTLNLICASMGRNQSCSTEELAVALSTYLIGRLDKLASDIEFLRKTLAGPTAGDVLKFLQFYASELKPLGDPSLLCEDEDARVDRLWESYRPPVTVSTLSGWRDRADRLAKIGRPGLALRTFWCIDDESTPLAQEVNDAVEQVDKHIQREIDLRLGK